MFPANTDSGGDTGREMSHSLMKQSAKERYSRHNPRKMVRVWAEKEMRNLKRLKAAGLRCPEAVEVRENVLVMGFIGDNDGW